MIDKYINQIISMNVLADSICIIDSGGYIRYFKVFRDKSTLPFPISEKELLGKHFMDAFIGINPETSTFLKALKGEATLNQVAHEWDMQGNKTALVECVHPIALDGEIIGAACISRAATLEHNASLGYINIKSQNSEKQNLYLLSDFIGNSAPMINLKKQILHLAKFNTNVLIYGETGTGKEMVAEAIHDLGIRKNKTFYSQNCAAIPSNLLESIFFGTEKGVYTGSIDRAGILEQAQGGTVFFDEINSLDIGMQAKLLKVLEEKKITRLGSDKCTKVDFRVIAATNEDPLDCVRSGKLRSDLFYRLSGVILEIPPLRKRKEDIPLLVHHFIQKYNKDNNENILGISDEVNQLFMNYNWPGNVRELKNAIESACIFTTTSMIELTDIPAYIAAKLQKSEEQELPACYISYASDTSLTLKEAMDSYEEQFLRAQLAECSNHSLLAKKLNVTRQTLINKLKKYNL